MKDVSYFDLGDVNKQAIAAGFEYATPGTSLQHLDQYVGAYITEAGYVPAFLGYHGFPSNCCLAVNDQIVHGVASSYELKEGDLLTIDCGVQYEGIIVDSADTRVIGTPSIAQQRLMINGRDILQACMNTIRDGVLLYDILKAGHNLAFNRGVYIFPEFGGHTIKPGILHGSFIPHTVPTHKSRLEQQADLQQYHATKLRAGEIICLEPVVTEERTSIILEEDGWTTRSENGKMSVHFEHCMLITTNGYEIIC